MCGIVASVATDLCRERLLSGLTALEYRGYDSAGIACIDELTGKLQRVRAVGDLSKLQDALAVTPLNGYVGMGHTRWATHGKATIENGHPHMNCHQTVAVVHNGVLHNSAALKAALVLSGHIFTSQTDSEVLAHLFSEMSRTYSGDFHRLLFNFISELKGTYALVLIDQSHTDRLFFARSRSPLVLGKGENGYFIASDLAAFDDSVTDVFFIPDGAYGWVTVDKHALFLNGNVLHVSFSSFVRGLQGADKEGFPNYMLKEIYEQPTALRRTLAAYRKQQLYAPESSLAASEHSMRHLLPDQIKAVASIHIIAAGSSWNAGNLGTFFFEEHAGIPVHVSLASEFLSRRFFFDSRTLYLFISQSGETADTLQALRRVREEASVAENLLTVALTNVAQSSLAREVNWVYLMEAGPEVAVASTKAFSSQVLSLYVLAITWGQWRGFLLEADGRFYEKELERTIDVLGKSITSHRAYIETELAPLYEKTDKAIFLGRAISYPFAVEAALKLKEITYTFVECYPSGELKHGPIALIDKNTAIVIFSVSEPEQYAKIVVNVQEVRARGGQILGFIFEGQDELRALCDEVIVFSMPADPLLGPLVMVGAAQLFAYSVTTMRGYPVDKPRNLAKSVTVE